MGMEYIESLAQRLKGKVSGAVYIVAPVTACDPGLFEDVVKLDKLTSHPAPAGGGASLAPIDPPRRFPRGTLR